MGFLAIAIGALLFSAVDVGRKRLLKNRSVVVTVWGFFVCSLPALFTANAFYGLPEISLLFWPFVFINVALISGAEILLYKAIKISDLSACMPFAAFTPAFLVFTSWIILGELPNAWGGLGILVTVVGAWLINLPAAKKGLTGPIRKTLKDKGSVYVLIVAFIWSLTANFSKLAIAQASDLFYMTNFAFFLALAFSVIVLLKYRKRVKREFFGSFWQFLLFGTCWGLAGWLQMFALTKILASYTIAIKQTRSVFSTIWGRVFFHEKNIRPRLLGAAVMALGAVIIVVFG